MKTLKTLVFSVALVFCGAPLYAAQFDRSGDGICVYENINFSGWEKCYGVDEEVSNLGSRGDTISSIRIYGRARVMVFQDSNFRGDSIEFSASVRDLSQLPGRRNSNWNDAIHSLFVTPGSGARGRRQTQQQQRGVCVYEDRDYRGRSQCWEGGNQVRDLTAGGWTDNISSIRVFGTAVGVFYRDVGFRGEYLTVDQDIPDLAELRGRGFSSWNDQISSLQIQADRGRIRR